MRARGDLAWPAGEHAGGEAEFETGPFGEGKAGTLFGYDNDEGIGSDVVFVQQLQQSAALRIVVGDFSEVFGKVISRCLLHRH